MGWTAPVEMVVKVMVLQSQDHFKSLVREAVVVEDLIMQKVEVAQEMLESLALPAYRTVGVAVVAKEQELPLVLEVVVAELWLLVIILQILCPWRGLEEIRS
jgi:hypothetical protein